MFDILGLVTRVLLAAPTAGAATPAAKPAPVAAAPTTATTTTTVAAPTAAQLVDKVQGFYQSITQVTASFRQTVTNSTFGGSKDSDGKVYLLKPGMMRFDYLQKAKGKVTMEKEFVSDGSTLFVIEHNNKQVIQQSLQGNMLPVAVTFLYGKGNLNTDFVAAIDTASKYGGADEITLKLTPKVPSAQYKNLILVVSKKDFHVTQSIIVDSSNNVNQFRFFSPDFKTAIAASKFKVDLKNAAIRNYHIVTAGQTATPAPGGPGGSGASTVKVAPAKATTK